MFDALRRVLEEEPNLAFALVFGSARRGTLRPTSDVDVAVEFRPEAPARPREARPPAARLESAARRRVDLILLDSAPAALTYRIFPDRRVLLERDHPALARRKAQAILQHSISSPWRSAAPRVCSVPPSAVVSPNSFTAQERLRITAVPVRGRRTCRVPFEVCRPEAIRI
jgi:predicted nucleotidyltransferase